MNEVLKMFNEAVSYYGPSDLITIMLSQKIDKLKAEEQMQEYKRYKREGKAE